MVACSHPLTLVLFKLTIDVYVSSQRFECSSGNRYMGCSGPAFDFGEGNEKSERFPYEENVRIFHIWWTI